MSIEQIIIKVIACEGGDLAVVGEVYGDDFERTVISSPWVNDYDTLIRHVWDQTKIVKEFPTEAEAEAWLADRGNYDWTIQWVAHASARKDWLQDKLMRQVNDIMLCEEQTK